MKLSELLSTLAVGMILLGACAVPSVPPAPASTPPAIPDATPAPTPTPTPKPTTIPRVTPYDGPIIDAHSQVVHESIDRIIRLMDQAGVACTILSTRLKLTPEKLVSFALNYPGRIIPAVRTKGYMEDKEKYHDLLKEQVDMEQYGAMAEVLIYHAQKGEEAPLSSIPSGRQAGASRT